MKTSMQKSAFRPVVASLSVGAAIVALADCYDTPKVPGASCGGTPQQATPDACERIEYTPDNETYCRNLTATQTVGSGATECNVEDVEVIKTVTKFTLKNLNGTKTCVYPILWIGNTPTGETCSIGVLSGQQCETHYE